MALVNIHPSLARFTNNQKVFELLIDNTASLVAKLCQYYPALASRIVNTKGELTPYVNIYVNGVNIDQITPPKAINQEDQIDLVTALVGG
jgi:molybdopterin converting factor small subunit